jgi:hypothetical protein
VHFSIYIGSLAYIRVGGHDQRVVFYKFFKTCAPCRKEKQEELVKRKNEETLRRLTAARDGDGGNNQAVGRKVRGGCVQHLHDDITMLCRMSA